MSASRAPCAVVLAKAPLAGQVKTRLAAALGAERAARLAQALLADTLEVLRAEPRVELALAYAPASARSWFADVAPDVLLLEQVEGDLGARMEAAARALFERGHRGVLAIGADAPHLLAAVLGPALEALARRRGAVACTDDGGYHLLALPEPAPWLREAIPWSSGGERAATLVCAREHGLEIEELPSGFDIDRPADLERLAGFLAAHPQVPCRATRRHLEAG